MKTKAPLFALLILPVSSLSAGTLADGTWTPRNCGDRPEIPAIDASSSKAYNQSISVFNAWQRTAQRYKNCLAQEANADNTLIANTANEEQTQLNEAVHKVKTEAAEIKQTLEGQ